MVLAWMGSLSGPLYAQRFAHIDQIFFTKAYGGANPLPQVLTVTSTGGALGFSASATTSSGGDWLAVSPTGDCCIAPAPVTVIVNANAALAVGSYFGRVVFTSGGRSLMVNVTLVVAPLGGAVFDNAPGQVIFSMKPGSQPPSQVLQIGNAGTRTLHWRLIGSTFNGANFLSVSAHSGTAPTPITLRVLPENLPNGGTAPGVYTGQLLFLAAGSTVTVPVSVSVGDEPPGARSAILAAGANFLNSDNAFCGGFGNQDTGYGSYTIAPDGNNTGQLVFEANPGSGAVPHFESLFADLGAGQHTLSFHFKAASNSWVYIVSDLVLPQSVVPQRVWFDLGTGTVGTNTFPGGTAAITALPNGWFRCSITFTVNVGQSATNNGFGMARGDQQFSYPATIGNGVFEWGQQFENGPLTAYVPIAGPCLVISDNEDGSSIAAGLPIGFTIGVGNVAAPGGTATAVALNAPLPAGTGINWSVSPAVTGCAVTGAVGSQTLTCNFGNLPGAGGGSALIFVHVSSATTASSCGVYTNTATASAPPARPISTIANSTTVVCVNNGPALRFVPVTPCRVADTRLAAGPFGAPALATNTARNFAIPAGPCGIPANAAAYSLNMTVVPLAPLGFLSVWPAGQPQPVVSTLNSGDGRVKANAAIVPAGVNGAITVFASNPSHVIIDINGYFVPAVGVQNLAFYPVTPCRVADTRIGAGTFGGPAMAPNVARNFPVPASSCGIPATAQAYAVNMTVVPSGGLGFLATWPAGSPQPVVSTLNAPTGAVTSNAAIVPAGVNGAITVLATSTTALIIDINGYFAPPGTGSLDFFTATPCRILDTRLPAGPFGGPIMGPNQTRNFLVPASTCAIPATAKAYSLNATVVPPTILGFLTLWGSGGIPFVSTLNSFDGSVVANAALVPAGASGALTAFTTDQSHLIVDINGFFQ
jgi:hypothetical protein